MHFAMNYISRAWVYCWFCRVTFRRAAVVSLLLLFHSLLLFQGCCCSRSVVVSDLLLFNVCCFERAVRRRDAFWMGLFLKGLLLYKSCFSSTFAVVRSGCGKTAFREGLLFHKSCWWWRAPAVKALLLIKGCFLKFSLCWRAAIVECRTAFAVENDYYGLFLFIIYYSHFLNELRLSEEMRLHLLLLLLADGK